MDKRHIEIEYRSMIDKNKYNSLRRFFHKNAIDLGADNKDVYFFTFPDKLLKVTNNISNKTAKITLKLNKIGKGSHFEEIEIPIKQRDIKKAVKIFLNICSYGSMIRSFQQRHNYLFKGVEIALKYSKNWGHHLELEVVINKMSKKISADKKIKKIASELEVKLLTEKELSEFVKRFELKYHR